VLPSLDIIQKIVQQWITSINLAKSKRYSNIQKRTERQPVELPSYIDHSHTMQNNGKTNKKRNGKIPRSQ
jgi:hypothetical protein